MDLYDKVFFYSTATATATTAAAAAAVAINVVAFFPPIFICYFGLYLFILLLLLMAGLLVCCCCCGIEGIGVVWIVIWERKAKQKTGLAGFMLCSCSLFFLCSSPLVRSLTRFILIFISSHEVIHVHEKNNTYVIPILLLLLLLIHLIASQKVMIYSTAIRSSIRNVCFE